MGPVNGTVKSNSDSGFNLQHCFLTRLYDGECSCERKPHVLPWPQDDLTASLADGTDLAAHLFGVTTACTLSSHEVDFESIFKVKKN